MKIIPFFCTVCEKSICNNEICIEKLLNDENCSKDSKLIGIKDIDNICFKHDENIISYCKTCKQNLCRLCNEHSDHEIIQISISAEQINTFSNKINDANN